MDHDQVLRVRLDGTTTFAFTAVIPATVMTAANYLRKTQAPKYGRDE